jgi:phosphatidylinositol phospholipase C delta
MILMERSAISLSFLYTHPWFNTNEINLYFHKQDELDEQDEEDSDEDDPKFQQDTAFFLEKEQDTACEYRKLITIQAGKPKGHLRDALKVDPEKVRRLSLSETQLAKATTSHGAEVIR